MNRNSCCMKRFDGEGNVCGGGIRSGRPRGSLLSVGYDRAFGMNKSDMASK